MEIKTQGGGGHSGGKTREVKENLGGGPASMGRLVKNNIGCWQGGVRGEQRLPHERSKNLTIFYKGGGKNVKNGLLQQGHVDSYPGGGEEKFDQLKHVRQEVKR